jgi:hypothetical protein
MVFGSRGFRAALSLMGFVIALFALPRAAHALTLQAPVGGDALTLPRERILCGAAPPGWSTDITRRRLRPPTVGDVGRLFAITIAPNYPNCTTDQAENVTLVATGPTPAIDPASVILAVDAGRLEVRGDSLEGVRIAWAVAGKADSDICLNVTKDKGKDVCVVNADRSLPADPVRVVLRWAPQGGQAGPDVVNYDRNGAPVPDDQMRLPLARVVIHTMFPTAHTVDMSSGEGRVELLHPEAVSSVDCGVARCDKSEAGMSIRGVPATATNLQVKVRLSPRVVFEDGENVTNLPGETLTVLRCPLALVSGPPLRNVDDLTVLVRSDKSCARDVNHLRWTASGETAEVRRSETIDDGVYALLWVGRVTTDRLTVVASRTDDGSVLAVASEKTLDAPPLRTSLFLPELGEIEFIPKNRDAILSVSPFSGTGKVVPLSVPGAYTVTNDKGTFHIRGEHTSGGYTALRFAYRSTIVPKEFAETGFGTLLDPVQRPIREASVPAPLSASSISQKPMIQLLCRGKEGRVWPIDPGTAPHIPYKNRDSCHLVVHRNRIPAESGEQRVDIDITVSNINGDRPEATKSHHLVLRHGNEPDVIWIRGVKQQFDHINVRVTHVIDESQYVSRPSGRLDLPSAQWTVVAEDARFKFYATATIPTALYRFSHDPQDLGTGPLALNFGVISRLTWLDSDGAEGLVGLEAGMVGMGLATDKSRQLALVWGLGLSVPLGNVNQPTQAAINIHAWVSYTVGGLKGNLLNDDGTVDRTIDLNPWAFVFGPSITVGNIGTFL